MGQRAQDTTRFNWALKKIRASRKRGNVCRSNHAFLKFFIFPYFSPHKESSINCGLSSIYTLCRIDPKKISESMKWSHSHTVQSEIRQKNVSEWEVRNPKGALGSGRKRTATAAVVTIGDSHGRTLPSPPTPRQTEWTTGVGMGHSNVETEKRFRCIIRGYDKYSKMHIRLRCDRDASRGGGISRGGTLEAKAHTRGGKMPRRERASLPGS